MVATKVSTHNSKHELCQQIHEKLHKVHPEQTNHHYAAILPTGSDSGWCEKGSLWC